MPSNTQPIFTLVPKAGWATVTTANTAMDGTGSITLIFTAHATAGSYVEKILAKALGTNVKTVVRVFLNNGTGTTAADSTLIAEATLSATTADNDDALTGYEIPLDIAIPPGYRLYVTIGTAVSSGWAFTCIGGDYDS